MSHAPAAPPAAHGLAVVGGVAAACTGFSCAPLTEPSPYVRPVRLAYTQARTGAAAVPRQWHTIEPLDSVAVLVHHTERRAYLLVRQLRPAVLLAELRRAQQQWRESPQCLPEPTLDLLAAQGAGLTYELCGGLVGDKSGCSLEQVALAEVAEELGYQPPPPPTPSPPSPPSSAHPPCRERLRRLFEFPEAVGAYGARLTVFYAAVCEGDALPGGGGGLAGEGEAIEVVALPDDQAAVRAFIADAAAVKSLDLQHALLLCLASGGAGGEQGGVVAA